MNIDKANEQKTLIGLDRMPAWNEVRCDGRGEFKHHKDDFYENSATGRRMPTCKDCKKSAVSARREVKKFHPNPRSAEPKRCPKCDVTKPAGEFYSHGSAKDGLSQRCKDCARAHINARYHKNRAALSYSPTTEPKRCTVCGVEKPAEKFNINKILKNGRVRSAKIA